MSIRPSDPSIVIYAPATDLYVGRYRGRTSIGCGFIIVRQNLLNYTDFRGTDRVNIYLKDIYSLSVKNAYADSGSYTMPCICCPCAGCPDGVLDVRAKLTKQTGQVVDVHIGVAMPNPEEFMEKLNAEISRHKSSPANIYT